MSGRVLAGDIEFVKSMSVDEMRRALATLAGYRPDVFAEVREDVTRERSEGPYALPHQATTMEG